jgi:hypothetical protein
VLKQLKVNVLGQSTLNQYHAVSGMVTLRLFSDIQLELGEQDLVLREYPKYWSVVSKRLENPLPPERESIEQLVTRRISQAMIELKRIWIPFTHLKLLAWEILERQEEMRELLRSGLVITTRDDDHYALTWAASYELDQVGEAAVDDLVRDKKWLTSIPEQIGRVVASVPSKNCIFLGTNPSHAIYENQIYSFTVDVGVVTLEGGKQFNIPTFRKKAIILKNNSDVLHLRDINCSEKYNIAFNGQVDPSLVKFAMTKVKKVVLMNHKSSS